MNVDIGLFLRDANFLRRKALPEAVVRGLGQTAERGRDAVRMQTRRVFKLHSEYIPRAIMSIPDPKKSKHIKAAVKALTGKYRDFQAAVFLRGARTPDKSLDFMVLHEVGGAKKSAQEGDLALPARDLKKYRYRTGKGATAKRWKPEELLKYYNLVGMSKRGRMRRQSNKGKPKAFILRSKRGYGFMIARRKTSRTRNIEILYRFIDTAKIDKRWNFVSTVRREVRRHVHSDIVSKVNRIKIR